MRCAKLGVAVLKASMLDWGFHLPWVFVHFLYIYRSAVRCAKFGVGVFKVSMLNRWGSNCHGYMCIFYMYRDLP